MKNFHSRGLTKTKNWNFIIGLAIPYITSFFYHFRRNATLHLTVIEIMNTEVQLYLCITDYYPNMGAEIYDNEKRTLSLKSKTDIASIVIKDTLTSFKRPAILLEPGNDSIILLYLIKKVSAENKFQNPPAIFIDHGLHYKETIEMIKSLSEDWKFRVISTRNELEMKEVNDSSTKTEDLSSKNTQEATLARSTGSKVSCSLLNSVEGINLLKIAPLNSVISHYRFDALFAVSAPWISQSSNEIFMTDVDKPRYCLIRPTLLFSEKDSWEFTLSYRLPIHPLYYKGYSSVSSICDEEMHGSEPPWIRYTGDRQKRGSVAKDNNEIIRNLKDWGYI